MKKALSLFLFLFLYSVVCNAQAVFLNFQTFTHGDTIDVNWVTETETNVDFFILERALYSNAIYTNTDTIPAFGNSTVLQYYAYNDILPLVDTCYLYRLRTVEINGSFSYTNPVTGCVFLPLTAVNNQLNGNFFYVFPNPSAGKIQINFGERIGSGIMEVFDAFWERAFVNEIINSTEMEMDLGELKNGMYFLRVLNNGKLHFRKLIIQMD